MPGTVGGQPPPPGCASLPAVPLPRFHPDDRRQAVRRGHEPGAVRNDRHHVGQRRLEPDRGRLQPGRRVLRGQRLVLGRHAHVLRLERVVPARRNQPDLDLHRHRGRRYLGPDRRQRRIGRRLRHLRLGSERSQPAVRVAPRCARRRGWSSPPTAEPIGTATSSSRR